jgi:hypothetical protein
MKRPYVAWIAVLFSLATPCRASKGDGPAAAEWTLRGLLREVAVREQAAAEAIAGLRYHRQQLSPDLPASQDLARAIALAESILDHQPAAKLRLPQDPGLLFVLARELPLPTPAVLVPVLIAELGKGVRRDLALVELLGKAPPAVSRPALRELAQRSRQSARPLAVQAALLQQLGLRETLDGAQFLFLATQQPNPTLRFFAGQALKAVLQRTRRRDPAAVSRWYQQLSRDYPSQSGALLEAVRPLLARSETALQTLPLLQDMDWQGPGGRDTSSLHARAQSYIARAWGVWFTDPEQSAWRGHLETAQQWSRPLLEQEETLQTLALQADLVARLLHSVLHPEDDGSWHQLLETSPWSADVNLLDNAFYGAFGPWSQLEGIRRTRWGDSLSTSLQQLVEAIEASTLQTGYGLLNRFPEQEEWRISWVFLQLAQLLLEDRADPAAAAELLEPRVRALRQMHQEANLRLLVESRLLQAQIELIRRDAPAAHQALDAGFSIVEGLRMTTRQAYLQELDRGELPVRPPEQTLWQHRGHLSDLFARLHLSRANLFVVLEADSLRAAEELWKARDFMLWTSDRWRLQALDLARRGQTEWARRALSCVEDNPDRLYDAACVYAHLGQIDQALSLLREHLEHRTFTPAGRAQARLFLRQDPDLQALHKHPDFPP